MYGVHAALFFSTSFPSSPVVLYQVLVSLVVLWNWLVVLKYLKSAGSVLGVIRSYVMLMFLPPMLLRRICLASRCVVQCSMRC